MDRQVQTQNTQQAYSSWVSMEITLIHRALTVLEGNPLSPRDSVCIQQERGVSVYLLANSSCREDPRAYRRFMFFTIGSCHCFWSKA